MKPRGERRRPRPYLWWVASLALVVVGVVLVVWGLHGRSEGPNLPGPIGRTSAPAHLSPRPSPFLATSPPGLAPVTLASYSPSSATAAPLVAKSQSHAVAATKRSVPIHLSIPAIGVSARLVQLGLNKDGTVQVPSSWYVPGWYKYGPSPGQKGSAVILGHVDSVAGPAVFYRLSKLRVGNRIAVTLKDGLTVRFAVIGLREYTKANFPDKLVYGTRPYDALQLVTCGGVFDSATHHYLSNIVVFTKRVRA